MSLYDAPTARLPSRRSTLAAWLFGVLVLAALFSIVARRGEIAQVGRLLVGLEPRWFAAALALQVLSQSASTIVWSLVFIYAAHPIPFWPLMRIRLVMIFANEAAPSAGLAGSLVAIRSLARWKMPTGVVLSAIVAGVMTSYVAGAITVAVSVVLLRAYGEISPRVLAGASAIGLAIVVGFIVLTWRRGAIAARLGAWLTHMPGVASAMDAVAEAPVDVLRSRWFWWRALPLQIAVLLLDGSTLFVLLVAVDARPHPVPVLGSFMMATAVTGTLPLPGNLGTFEAALVAMLNLAGVRIEPALAAALLLRGFTIWMPMIPGLWYSRRLAHP